MKVSTWLSLAEYSLYSGFVVLTLLQVVSLELVTGPLFQALRLNRLKDANLEDHHLWARHDTLTYVILRYPLCGTCLNSVLIPLLNSVNWFVKLLTLLFCFRTLLLWLYDSDHIRVGYLSRSRNMWLIRILRDA